MRLGLRTVIFADLFIFRQEVKALADAERRSCLGLGRFVDDRRALVFRVECLAKIARLRIDCETRFAARWIDN
jgi:hypothetical protein